MRLHFKHYPGTGPTLLILHGLYGNQGNWAAQARQLAPHFNVYALDARNHGQSPWADTMGLAEMATDVADTMRTLTLPHAHLLGHSMGGKTAMMLALTQPGLVQSLCVVDIAPVAYHQAGDGVIKALCELDLSSISTRGDADNKLAVSIPEKFIRDFLLANLQRSQTGGWCWRFNLPVLASCFQQVTGWPDGLGTYPGPTLFIKGEHSSYILPDYEAATLQQFPHTQLKVVNGAGHWVHSEKPEAVLRLIRNFLG
ncbi:MAG: alpha/beta fold hydrolase [Gammaproteobacteria bacterium]|jgi:esterase